MSMETFMNRLVWLVSAFAFAALLVGCGKAQEAAMERAIETGAAAQGSPVDVDLDGGTVTMTAEEGNVSISTGENVALPAGLPKDVPVYPGAQVRAAIRDANTNGYQVQLFTKDPLTQVTEYFGKEAEAKGWIEDTLMKQGGAQPMHILGYHKDGRTLNVVATAEGDGTSVSVMTATEEQ